MCNSIKMMTNGNGTGKDKGKSKGEAKANTKYAGVPAREIGSNIR